MSSLALVTAPAGEPLTLVRVRSHLRLDATGSPATHPDDDDLNAFITAARERVEGRNGYLRRALVSQIWDYKLDDFPSARGSIRIPLPPLISVGSISYVDSDGVSQTLAASVYDVDTAPAPGEIHLAWNQTWPSARNQKNAVTVRFTAGYAVTNSPVSDYGENVPKPILQAMLLMIGDWYNNREETVVGSITSQIPMGVKALLSPYRIYGGF